MYTNFQVNSLHGCKEKVGKKYPAQFFDSEGKGVIASFCKRLILVLGLRRDVQLSPRGSGMKIFFPLVVPLIFVFIERIERNDLKIWHLLCSQCLHKGMAMTWRVQSFIWTSGKV